MLFQDYLLKLPFKLNLTTDIWTSISNDAYLCLTGHWIDQKWKLQKTVLQMIEFPHPHDNAEISQLYAVFMNLFELGDDIQSITSDNASNMILACENIINELKRFNKSAFNIRCSAHIMNLIVHVAFNSTELKGSISNIRDLCRSTVKPL